MTRAGHSSAVIQAIKAMRAVEGKATAYVCRDFVCQLPVNDPGALRAQLDGSDALQPASGDEASAVK